MRRRGRGRRDEGHLEGIRGAAKRTAPEIGGADRGSRPELDCQSTSALLEWVVRWMYRAARQNRTTCYEPPGTIGKRQRTPLPKPLCFPSVPWRAGFSAGPRIPSLLRVFTRRFPAETPPLAWGGQSVRGVPGESFFISTRLNAVRRSKGARRACWERHPTLRSPHGEWSAASACDSSPFAQFRGL
jgi:hypothetical protein